LTCIKGLQLSTPSEAASKDVKVMHYLYSSRLM
jgi:hypothetical protein